MTKIKPKFKVVSIFDLPNNIRQTECVDVDLNFFRTNAWQSDKRAQLTFSLRALADSIYHHGLLNPIHVKSDGTVLDGHRRVAALRYNAEVGLPVASIRAYIYTGSGSESAIDMIFIDSNKNNKEFKSATKLITVIKRRLSGEDGPSGYGRRYDFIAERVVSLLSEDQLEQFCREERGITVYNIALKMTKFCGITGDQLVQDKFTAECTWYLMNGPRQRLVVEYMKRRGCKSAVLLRCIEKNRELPKRK